MPSADALVSFDGTARRLTAMPAAPLLSEQEIKDALQELPAWRMADDRLVREFEFPSFRAALNFVTQVADTADEMDHHPDVTIHWGDVTFSLWTHAAGGITRRDLRLARAMDELARAR